MKYLDNTGLSYIWQKIKQILSTKFDNLEIENNNLYGISNGERIFGPVPLNNYTMTLTNTAGWESTEIAQNTSCNISFNWSYLENNTPVGVGNLRLYTNQVLKTTATIEQGEVTLDISDYLNTGTNVVTIIVTSSKNTSKSLTYNINQTS